MWDNIIRLSCCVFQSCQRAANRCSYRLTLQRYEHFLYIQTFFIKICKLFYILFVSA